MTRESDIQYWTERLVENVTRVEELLNNHHARANLQFNTGELYALERYLSSTSVQIEFLEEAVAKPADRLTLKEIRLRRRK